MIAVDTNVLLRFITNDDRTQADRAQDVPRGGAVMIARTVLLEAEGVLRKSRYRCSRCQVATAFRKLLRLPGVRVDDPPAVARALDWFESGLGFADALHLASSRTATEFVAFDQTFARRAARLRNKPPVRHS